MKYKVKRKGKVTEAVKGWKKSVILAAFLLLVCAVTSKLPMKAQAAPSTQDQIKDKEKEKDELENQLNQKQDELEGLQGEQDSLKGELNNLNTQLSNVSDNLADLEQQIRVKEQEIAQTQEALAQARETERLQYERMVDHVRYMYELEEESVLNALLRMDGFANMLNMADFYENVMAYSQKMLDDYEANRILIEEQEARLQTEMSELANLKIQAEAEKSKVSGLISQTSNSISQYADQIEAAMEEALAYEAKIQAAQQDLEALYQKYAEELAMSQAAANAAWRDISEVSFQEGDRYLLANLIYCEAGNQPYAGKLAVGSVVINRVLSSKYPDSVVGVIYQKSQFSPAREGGSLEKALAINKANADCYRAADEAMAGATNVGQCLYFRTIIEGLSGIIIGDHIFY